MVNRETHAISMLAADDRQGGRSAFTFANVKENTGLTDKVFEFSIPRGADVIRTGQP